MVGVATTVADAGDSLVEEVAGEATIYTVHLYSAVKRLHFTITLQR
jgi:hypothetical protein